jgi:archaellum component FlaF (FlaF/FlaG flagellin family)
MEKYTYNGNTKTTKITTDNNGEIVSKQEEIIVDWIDDDLSDELPNLK